MSSLLEPLTLDLFGEPLRPPTRRERHRVAVQARPPRAAPAPVEAPPPVVVTPASSPLHPQLWRAAELGRADARCCPSGFAALDAELPGGGWPTRALTELLLPQPGSVEWRLLAPSLALRARQPQAGQRLLLIGPPHAPHPRGLAAWGLAAAQCLWIAAPEETRLWALEQALKADADETLAVLAWLPRVRPEQLRRLQILATGCRAPVFVLRPDAGIPHSSAAPLRLRVAPGPAWAQLRAEILKRRGPPPAQALLLHAPPPALLAVLAPRLLGLRTPTATRPGPRDPGSEIVGRPLRGGPAAGQPSRPLLRV